VRLELPRELNPPRCNIKATRRERKVKFFGGENHNEKTTYDVEISTQIDCESWEETPCGTAATPKGTFERVEEGRKGGWPETSDITEITAEPNAVRGRPAYLDL